jgi:hypothetical protein
MKSSKWIIQGAGVLAVVGMFVMAGVAYATVPTFSQSSVTVGAGQSTSITSSNNIDPYVEANSAPTIVTVSVNGTQVNFAGLAPGTSDLTLCGVGTATDCTNITVNVTTGSTSSSSGGLSFSQNGFSLPVGNTQTVTISGGNGTYSMSGISNGSVLSGSLSGNNLTVSGIASGSGTITICDTASDCGTLSVNVGSSSSSSGSGISFSQNNFSLVTGASQTVLISGGNGTYSVNNNSNSSAVATSLSGNGITVYGTTAGTATITVCDTSNNCGTLSVTANTSSANQAVTFSVPSPTIAAGQSLNITLSGGSTGYVVFANATPTVAQASITGGNTLSLYAEVAGTDTIAVCATGGGCNPVTVTVTGGSSTTTAANATTPTTTTTAPTTTVTPTTTSTGTVVENTALLTEIQALQTALTQALNQMESIQTQLNQIEAQVSAGSGSSVSTNASATSGTFTELLTVGSEDAQVTALQNRLTTLGFYSGPITGYYGSLTEQAVMKYQTSEGITATGSVGPETRAALNG